jgi:hypothetical protein
MHPTDIVQTLQLAIGPVILISAVGLLLLTLNNRLTHAIDRARSLAKDADGDATPGLRKQGLFAEINVLWKRMKLIRTSMVLAAVSALFATILIITLFVTTLLGLQFQWLLAVLFFCSLSSLVGSLSLLILDVDSALVALKLALDSNQLDLRQ